MSEKEEKALFDYDAKLSIKEAVPMGLQHVVAAIVGIVTPGIMIAKVCNLSSGDTTIMIQTSLIFSAIATFMQLFPIFGTVGSRLPVMMGASFAYVPILMAIGGEFGIGAIFGAQLVGSILVILVGLSIKKIRILFPPLVTGTVILSIGLSLFPVAIKYMAGGAGSPDFGSAQNWLVALLTFGVVFYFNYFSKGFLKLSSILNGMIIGYIVSLVLGMVNFMPVKESSVFQVITPLYFGLDFQIVPILTLVVMFIVDAVQAIGQFTATTVGAMDREPTDKELSGGIMGSGFSNFIGSFFGSVPVATFGQNVGLVTVTRVINKYVMVFASVILLVAGFVPKVASILTTIPYAVIGGATVSVFASISMTGVRMISTQELTPRNTGVVGIALAFGIGVTLSVGCLSGFPPWVTTIFGHSEVILTTIVAVILNVVLKEEKQLVIE
ncbi:nucleobase:cation symporter-2 family protein [Enterococcus caccae]|uniref:Xanthine permease n=1 Tax=Enterococcus caccae ATCC BAA-1240 TaxID=1158612 RepID=R3W7P7_9ENTE|nr:nucleobase:cation symporter-2 family protein [Enterococcus caccae]EOL43517.1 xanthine permease [Enterococcus caccae ATCC BAA-1240]EOT68083.1 xanthine/uracil permease [Enterococcus caccae ATCC BAA-1240]OJG28427.1 xanthine permease [Enterococcus caccae]